MFVAPGVSANQEELQVSANQKELFFALELNHCQIGDEERDVDGITYTEITPGMIKFTGKDLLDKSKYYEPGTAFDLKIKNWINPALYFKFEFIFYIVWTDNEGNEH